MCSVDLTTILVDATILYAQPSAINPTSMKDTHRRDSLSNRYWYYCCFSWHTLRGGRLFCCPAKSNNQRSRREYEVDLHTTRPAPEAAGPNELVDELKRLAVLGR
jgi:hypothetical protein